MFKILPKWIDKLFTFEPIYSDTCKYLDKFEIINVINSSLAIEIIMELKSTHPLRIYSLEKKLNDEILKLEKLSIDSLIALAVGILGIVIGLAAANLNALNNSKNIIYKILGNNSISLEQIAISIYLICFVVLALKCYYYNKKKTEYLRYFYFYLGIINDFKSYGTLAYQSKYSLDRINDRLEKVSSE